MTDVVTNQQLDARGAQRMSGGLRSRPQRPRAPSGTVPGRSGGNVGRRHSSRERCRSAAIYPCPARLGLESHDARDGSRAGPRPAAAGAAAGKLTVARILSRPRRLSADPLPILRTAQNAGLYFEASETRWEEDGARNRDRQFPATQRGGLAHAAAGRAPAREPGERGV